MSSLRRRPRADKKRARGAAMVEALVILPVFIAVNGLLFYVLHLYDAKLTTVRVAKNGAWSRAVTGCRGNAPAAGGAQIASAAADSSLAGLSGQVQTARQLATTPSLRAPFDSLTMPASGAVAQRAAQGNTIIGGDSFSTDETVLCNENTHDITAADERRTVDDFYGRFIGR